MDVDEKPDDVPVELYVKIKKLINDGYEQTSYKYRHLNRIPPDTTGLDALKSIHPPGFTRIMENAHQQAAQEYMRLCDDEQIELTREEFKEFRRQTGRKFHEP